jgi:ParB family transcriptional regulator, chromosome partitioning protein
MKFEAIKEVPLGSLEVGPAQARIREVEKDLDELVDNIRVHGQLEPIVVAPRPGGKYEIITGQRRFLAHQRLHRQTIYAAILPDSIDQETAKVLSVSENLVRTNLSAKDLIDACTSLYRKYGSVKAVAEELGLPGAKVAAYVKYDRLHAELRQLVDSGEVDIATALRVEDAVGELDLEGGVDLGAVAQNLAGLTRAQQSRLLRGAGVDDLRRIAAESAPSQAARVRQIIVTLPQDVPARLQEWASAHAMTQDQAASMMIQERLLAAP